MYVWGAGRGAVIEMPLRAASTVSAKHRQSDIGTANTKPKQPTNQPPPLLPYIQPTALDLLQKQIKLKDSDRHNFKQCNKGRVL